MKTRGDFPKEKQPGSLRVLCLEFLSYFSTFRNIMNVEKTRNTRVSKAHNGGARFYRALFIFTCCSLRMHFYFVHFQVGFFSVILLCASLAMPIVSGCSMVSGMDCRRFQCGFYCASETNVRVLTVRNKLTSVSRISKHFLKHSFFITIAFHID